MAITQGLTSSFLRQLMLGVHNFNINAMDDFKMALYTSSATLNKDTTAYTATGEISGSGYTAGGIILEVRNVNVSTSGVVYASFVTANFGLAVFTGARGALIYNSTPSADDEDGALTNPSVCVLDFGTDKSATGDRDFEVRFPAHTEDTALIRIRLAS